MTRRSISFASIAASLLILPAFTGCVLHKNDALPPVAIAPSPEPTPAPLYTSELAQTDHSLPNLPAAPLPAAQPAPPPPSEVQPTKKRNVTSSRRNRGHRGETEVAERESRETPSREKDNGAGANGEGAANDPGAAANGQSVAKVTAKAPAGDTSVATPIGQLTAGATQDNSQSRRQAVDLIQTTEHGVNSLNRGLSGDESKTVAQIHSFLQQAQHALHNGDIDGAVTLATKAKVLLAELTDTQ